MLEGKTVLITGSARRVGRAMAIAVAQAGADVIIHHGQSEASAQATAAEIARMGRRAWVLQANFEDPAAAQSLVEQAWALAPLFALVNNAAIFEALSLAQTSLADWQRHLNINLTAPFLLSQAFAARIAPDASGRIVNILDWRALRPAADHFPYTISKAGLVALTQALAVALAPRITVNGLALGAILPPADGSETGWVKRTVPAGRWAELEEVNQALLFFLDGPAYITGEILHVDGGRHLV